MTKKSINYKEFIKYVHQRFEDRIEIEEVENILYLSEGYNKDSPTSLGKSLTLNRLVFAGIKIDGEKFKYDHRLHQGINVWIADNGKGKSTVFKIIKFALTGRDSIKPDVKPWIHEVLLEYNIGEVTYTCVIDRTGRDRGALYRLSIERFLKIRENQKIDSLGQEIEFEFKSRIQFEEKLQEFFFEQFSYYTLKYTQHSSKKDEFELKTANLSWATYFKSIYLESKDYEFLFFEQEGTGAQGRKIFEMILGLRLTYPINMLNLQRDRVLEEIGRIKLSNKTKIQSRADSRENINNRLVEVQGELAKIRENGQIQFNEKPLMEEYNRIQGGINQMMRDERLANEAYQDMKNKEYPLEEELTNLETDKKKIVAEIHKLERQELNLQLYRESESFFSNLDIKACPHCETEVTPDKKEKERENHICSLCGEISTEQKIGEAELSDKAEKLEEEKKELLKKLEQVEVLLRQRKHELDRLKKTLAGLYSKIVGIPSIVAETDKLKEIEDKLDLINNERRKRTVPVRRLRINRAVDGFLLGLSSFSPCHAA